MQKRISVRNLVEFILRSGSIDSRFTGRDRLEEGRRIHRKLQNAEGYCAEIYLSITEVYSGVEFTVEGRADGVIITENTITIDEIKTTLTPLEMIEEDFSKTHWAQAMCYGYIYSSTHAQLQIDIRLTYYEMESGGIKRFTRTYTRHELAVFFADLLEKYAVWVHFENDWKKKSTAAMRELQFPFSSYRAGQRALAAAVYRTIAAEGRLFAMAPTGIGKTVSTIFPALKAMGESLGEKIFYLTAKTVTRIAAEMALNLLRKEGLRVKSVTITAKDKICFHDERNCKPMHCIYANGHYDRINNAILDALRNCDAFSAQSILEYAQRHRVCPFELSLDLTLWSDIIVCDYNYVFDPQVYLKRFFSDGGDYVMLIDEAHNMADRAREMFSAAISKRDLMSLRRALSKTTCARTLMKINKHLVAKRRDCIQMGVITEKEPLYELNSLLELFTIEFSKWLGENPEPKQELLQVYFDVLSYINISEIYDERFVMLYDAGVSGEIIVKQFCTDPSRLLEERYESGRAVVLFSATLTPSNYFTDVLGGGENCKYIALPSPFPQEKMMLLIADNISTKYKNRDLSCERVAELIFELAKGKTGNYIAYFPSYRYLSLVYSVFEEKYPDVYIVQQTGGMTEAERDEFLALFDESETTMVAFCVLGGIFSEGIDLTGDRLIGTVIVGVGLPQLNAELDIVSDYYENRGCGFDFAYRFPGMNKVLQAAGRVIRSEEDEGVVLLIDDRFSSSEYRRIFPEHWRQYRFIRNAEQLKSSLSDFWK